MTMTKGLPKAPDDVGVDEARWGRILPLLSLDVVAPFFRSMGLQLADDQPFKELVRKLILDVRREVAADRSKTAQYSAAWFLGQFGAALGAELRAHVLWWGTYVFTGNTHEHAALTSWMDLFRYCGDDPRLWQRLAERRGEILAEFKRAGDMKEYQRIHDEVYAQPLSDWDLHMYAVYSYDDDDPMAPTGPDTDVYPTIRTFQAYRFWAWMLTELRPLELETLYENAVPIATLPDNQTLTGQLSHPRSLDIGL